MSHLHQSVFVTNVCIQDSWSIHIILTVTNNALVLPP